MDNKSKSKHDEKSRCLPCGTGPVDLLLHPCGRLNARWDSPARFIVLGTVFDVNEVENLSEFAHYLRDAARKMVWTQTRQDQARGDYPEHAALGELGLGERVDRDRTLSHYNAKETTEDVRGTLRLTFVNGVWTTKVRANMTKNRDAQCDSAEEEDLEHLWRRCPAWSSIRKMHHGTDGIITDALKVDAWPPCDRE